MGYFGILVSCDFLLSSKPLNFVVFVDWWEYLIRKLAHFFEFGVLSFLIFRILSQTEKRHVYWNLFWAFAFTVLYAISDEYHQTFIHGRTGTYTDVLIDSAGALLAIWLMYLNFKYKKSTRRK
jgi:VanZ family protein